MVNEMNFYMFIKPLTIFNTRVLSPYKIEYGKENLNHDEPVIYCSNHRHFYDPFLIAIVVKKQVFFMAKKELFEIKILRPIIKALGAFPVDRHKPDFSSIRTATQLIEENKNIGIFPEGTRNRTSFGVQQLHEGAVWLAMKCGVPIVPMFIDNRGPFHRMYYFVGEKIVPESVGQKRVTSEMRQATEETLFQAMKKLEEMAHKKYEK